MAHIRHWLPLSTPKRYAIWAGPMDPGPTVGHVLAFEAAVSQTGCDGIIVAIAEGYGPSAPKLKPYSPLTDRIVLAQALRYVVKVVTYVTEADLTQLIADLAPAYQILRPSDKEKFQGCVGGMQPLFMAELEARNYRAELIARIQQHAPH